MIIEQEVNNSKNFKEIINRVKNLTEKEKHHILNILKKHNIEYTKNHNGYFFNLEKIDSNIINKLEKCIDLIEKNRDLIYSLDKKREMHLDYYKQLIEDKLKQTILLKQKQHLEKLTLINQKDNSLDKFIKKRNDNKNDSKVYVDPDILMKNYLKSKKITKKSIYYNLFQCISKRKNQNKKDSSNDSDNCNSNENSNDDNELTGDIDNFDEVDVDIDVGDGDIGDGDIVDTANIDDIEDIDEEENIEDDDDEIDDIDEIDEIDEIEEIDEHIDDSEHEIEDGETNISYTEDTKTNSINEDLLNYYKNILKKKHGYEFNDDIYVKMNIQPYIQKK